MTNGASRLWPYEARHALLAVPIVFVVLLVLLGVAHSAFGFPEKPESGTLSVLLLVSFVPLGLLLVDTLISRGATIEYLGAKLAFPGAAAGVPASVSVATNIGVPAQPINDSSTSQILDALRVAVGKEVVIIDLESGKAWWATRLLVLVAGAIRHGRPAAIVFVATIGGVSDRFQGWADPKELLPALLDAKPTFRLCYERAKAAAAQWDLVEPSATPIMPHVQTWMTGLATQTQRLAFEPSGLPNPFAFEQFLALELGREVEEKSGGEWLGVARLRDLFLPVLHEEQIDEGAPDDEKVTRLLDATGRYVAITRAGVYQRLLAKEAGVVALVKSLAEPRQPSTS